MNYDKKTSNILQFLEVCIIGKIFDIIIKSSAFPFISTRYCSCSELVSLEVIHEVSGSLDASIGELAYFLTVETIPPASVELAVELTNELRVDKVHKGIADIAGIEVIHWQVKEIDFELMIPADLLEQHVLSVFVRDVADHQSSAPISLNLHITTSTLSGIILYSCTSSPAPDFLFL